MIEALALLKGMYPKLRLKIVGQEENIKQRQLRDQAERMRIDSAVEFTGFQRSVTGMMADCSIGVIASTGSEAVSRVALEWMASSRPVVSTRVGCLPELVEEGETGFLVDPKDAPALARALGALLHDPQKMASMGAAGRARAEERFNLKNFCDKTEYVYRQALQEVPLTRLSAFLIVRNEARDIEACLVSLRGLVDEIVVVDDFSTDETADKCRALGAKVVQRKLDGFGAQKQFALEQTSGEWALSIDADERITPSLAAEISATLEHPKADGYFVRRNLYFLGHLLRHGGLDRDWVLRLFRRQKGHFENVPVHESIQVEGVTAKLSNPLEHYSYASLAEYNEKCERYTELAAQEAWRNKNGFLARSFTPGLGALSQGDPSGRLDGR